MIINKMERLLEKRRELLGTKEVQDSFASINYGINERKNSTLRLYSYIAWGCVEATIFVEAFRQYLIERTNRNKD